MNESLDKKKVSLDLSDWTDVIPKDIPRQQNSWDCGVFTCMVRNGHYNWLVLSSYW